MGRADISGGLRPNWAVDPSPVQVSTTTTTTTITTTTASPVCIVVNFAQDHRNYWPPLATSESNNHPPRVTSGGVSNNHTSVRNKVCGRLHCSCAGLYWSLLVTSTWLTCQLVFSCQHACWLINSLIGLFIIMGPIYDVQLLMSQGKWFLLQCILSHLMSSIIIKTV